MSNSVLFLRLFFFLPYCFCELNIVQSKTLSCYADSVQFVIADSVSVIFVNSTKGNCSEIPDVNRTVRFNYEECGGKATRLEPYGPLTKLNFVAQLNNGEIYELTTQCFFDDTIGWYSDNGMNFSDASGQEQGFLNPSELSGSFLNAKGQAAKSVSLGDVVVFNIRISDDAFYKSLLPYDCKFSSNRSGDNENDMQFVYKGCPQKLPGCEQMKRETLTSYKLSFNAFQINSESTLYVKCSTIKLCLTADDPRCNDPCFSNASLSSQSNSSGTIRTTLSLTTALTSNSVRHKREMKINQTVEKSVEFQGSINVNNDADNNKVANDVSFNFLALILSLVVILLFLVIIIGIVFMIHSRKKQRKIFRMAQYSRNSPGFDRFR